MRKPIWLTKMYWCGPFIDPGGNTVSIHAAWLHRAKQFGRRLLTVRNGKRLVADIFFTLWVSTDVLELAEGKTPVLPLAIYGAVFGSLLVCFEWLIFYEEYRNSAPLHVLWQPRVAQAPHQPNLFIYFECKNSLPFEVRCTFTNSENVALGAPPNFRNSSRAKRKNSLLTRPGVAEIH
jgi:hypothetical protein